MSEQSLLSASAQAPTKAEAQPQQNQGQAPATEPVKAPQDAAPAKTEAASPSAKAPAADGKTPEQAAPTAVPEKYNLKLPEGVTKAAPELEALTAFYKEQGFSEKQAQAALDRELKQEIALKASFEQASVEALKTMSTKWMQELEVDPEIGGAEFKRNVENANQFLDRFDPDKTLRKVLDQNGLGNFPGLVKVFARAGKAMAPGAYVHPQAQSTAKPLAQQWYPEHSSQGQQN